MGKERIGNGSRRHFDGDQCKLQNSDHQTDLSECEPTRREGLRFLDRPAKQAATVGEGEGMGFGKKRTKYSLGSGEYLVQTILDSGRSSANAVEEAYSSQPRFRAIKFSHNYDTLFRKAMDMAKAVVKNESFSNLAKNAYAHPAVYIERDQCADPAESFRWLCKILEHNHIDFHDFVSNVCQVMDRVIVKVNSLFFKGEPDGGKTLVATSIARCGIYYANIQKFSKGQSFAFQDAVGARVIVINEPMFTDEYIETLKNIFEGHETSVEVKYKANQSLDRTPVIIAGNHDLAMYVQHGKAIAERAFKSRVIRYDFSPYPALRDFRYNLHPGLWYLAIRKFLLDTQDDPDHVYCDMTVPFDLSESVQRLMENEDDPCN